MSENQDTGAIFSAYHFADKFAYKYVPRRFSGQRAFQFGFLITLETFPFFSLKSSLEFTLHCGKYISLSASPPIF